MISLKHKSLSFTLFSSRLSFSFLWGFYFLWGFNFLGSLNFLRSFNLLWGFNLLGFRINGWLLDFWLSFDFFSTLGGFSGSLHLVGSSLSFGDPGVVDFFIFVNGSQSSLPSFDFIFSLDSLSSNSNISNKSLNFGCF